MADFDLSLVIRGDGSGAAAAAAQAESAIQGLDNAQKGATVSAEGMAAGSREAAAAQTELMRQMSSTTTAIGQQTQRVQQLENQAKRTDQTLKTNTVSVGQQKAAYLNLGQQIQDITLGLATGQKFFTVLGQQAGQTATAVQLMGGRFASVGAFFAGPWGSIIIAATTILGGLATALLASGTAAETAKAGADSLGDAQGVLGKIFDLTTGKITSQNEVLRLNARLMAITMRAEALKDKTSAEDTFRSVGGVSIGAGLGQFFARGPAAGGANPFSRVGLLQQRGQEQSNLLSQVRSGAITREEALKKSDTMEFSGLSVTKPQFQQALIDQASSEARDKIADLIDQSLDDNKLASGLRKTGKEKKPKKAKVDTKTPNEMEQILSIENSFDDAPTLIDRAAKATRELDKIMADLSKRKPPGFAGMIAEAQRAKGIVEDSLDKPYRQFIKDQEASFEQQKLINAGQADEADALKIITQLEKQMGPLTPARKDAVLATVQALKAEQRETEKLQQSNQKYLTALNDIKGAIRGVLTDGAQGIADLPKRLISAFTNLRADTIMEKLFGEAFQDLQDRVNGVSVVKDASAKMAEAVNSTVNPLQSLADAATAAAQGVGGLGGGTSGTGPTGNPTNDLATSILAKLPDSLRRDFGGSAGTPADGSSGPDIVVTGRRSPEQFFGSSITKLLGGSDGQKGLISKEAAGIIGSKVGQAAGGAATGAMVNSFIRPLGKALGIKTSQTGAEIGGAIGSFIPIPGGQIIGSILGSVIGGLFKTTKTGSATIGNNNGQAAVTGQGGNNATLRQNAASLGNTIADQIDQVVQQLGGTLGNFSVSIGQRDKKFVVDPTGGGRTKGSGVQKFDSQEDAQAAALANAIADGAVAGISDAMQRALHSSTDLNKSVAEALKVQQVELLIGGLGATLKKNFDDFDREAKERVRIAQQYGLDVVKVEQINAEQRTKLVDDTLKARVASLQDFLDSVKFGDLSEGTIADKRDALLAQRDALQKDAEAGKDGAADKLANVAAQLLQLTRDGYGTAGDTYAGDRSSTVTGVEKVIQMENDRVNQAAGLQQATADAVVANNALTSETNDLLAIANSRLGDLVGAVFGGGGSASLGLVTQRYTQLV